MAHARDADRQVRLLGDVAVTIDGRRIEDGASPRALLVLAALALAGGRPVDRAELAFRLWPESTDQQARTNLRKVIHELRTWLPDEDEWLEIDQRRARLRSEVVSVDVAELRAAALRGDERAAADLYRGPLLPGHWEEWVLDERRSVEELAVDVLHRELAESGDADRQIEAAQRLLQLDRADELAHRTMIRAHAASGNRAAALRAFRTCSTVLDRELGVAPSPETVAAYEAAREGGGPPGAGRAAPGGAAGSARRRGSPLIGRDAELGWLGQRWVEAAEGRRLAALVTGESGIGKSRLVDELATRSERSGHVVLRSRAYESDGGRTLAPVVDWLGHAVVEDAIRRLPSHHRDELGRLLPGHAPPTADRSSGSDPTDARALLFDAVAAALAAAGDPLLLVLDDLQWCGPDTVDLVCHLLRRGPAPALLVVAGQRDHERAADPALGRKLSDLRLDGVLDDRRLSRLQPVHTAAIARAVTDVEWSAHQVALLHTETDGHPLFVVEAARAGPGGDHLTSTIRGVIERRLGLLGVEHRTLLDVAAVFGRRFGADELALASGRDEDEIVDGVDDLWQHGLVVQHGHEFDFAHDQFREVIVAAISPARRARLHRDVAAALLTVSGGEIESVADRLAEHYERAGMLDEAIDARIAAATRASTIGAHPRAVEHLERALRLLADRPAGATRDAVELRALTDLAIAFVVQAGYGSPETQRTWDRAAAVSHRLGTTLPGPVLRGLGLAALSGCRFERAAGYGEALCALDDPVARIEGHYVLGVTRFWQGRFADADEHLSRAVDDYDPAASHDHRSHYGQDPKPVCGSRLAYLRALQGRAQEADALMEEAEAMARSLDDPLTIWYVWTYRLLLDRYVGRPTTVPAPEQPVRGFFAGVPDEIRVLDTALAGSDAAQDELAAVAHAWRQDGHQLLLTLWLAKLADVHLRRGEPEQALEHLDEADSFTERWGQGYLASDLARRRAVALRLLSDPACVGYASLAVERSVEMGACGLVLRARAELLRCSGDPAVAATLRAELDDLAGTHHGADIDDACSALEEAAAGDGDV